MNTSYNEFEGTDLDPSVDYDYDDDQNALLPILGASALLAVVAGGLLVAVGRKRNPTPEERIQDVLELVEKRGKKAVKATTHAVEQAHLNDLLSDAIGKARHLSSDAVEAAKDSHLTGLLDDALTRTRKAVTRLDIVETAGDVGKSARKDLRRRIKKAAHSLDDLHLDETLDDATKKARQAASHFDVEGAIDTIKEKVAQAVDAVRDDLAPKAMHAVQDVAENVGHTVRDDVLPAAQDAVEKVRSDVLPAAGEQVSTLVEKAEVGKKARQAAEATKSGIGSLNELIRSIVLAILHKVMDELLPEARKAGGRAAKVAREDMIPAAAHTASEAAHTVREDVLPKVGDAAAHTGDVLGDLLKMARERADDMLNKSQPAASEALSKGKKRVSDSTQAAKGRASDAAEFARHRASDAATFALHRASDASGFARHRASDAATFAKHRADDVAGGVRGGASNVTGALSTAGHGVKGAVGTTAHATAHVTRDLTGILFWLSMLGGVILLVFVPDRDKQKEMWNGALQFLGELREMWRDLQGEDFDELEAGERAGA